MQKLCCVMLTILLFFFSVSAKAYESFYIEEYHSIKKDITTSDDGKYSYIINPDTNNVYFYGFNEKNLSVLEVPGTIDGNPVVGVMEMNCESNCFVKIKFGDETKLIGRFALPRFDRRGTATPVCGIELGEKLEEIQDGGLYNYRSGLVDLKLKILKIPKSAAFLGYNSVDHAMTENIVIEGDPNTKIASMSFMDEYTGENGKKTPYDNTNIYFAGSTENTDANTFDYYTRITDWELGEGGDQATSPRLTIYKKPGAKGFEKFEEAGYTIKEYTDEWWKDIKEIESVTLSGKGLTENETVTQKLSDSELKWMDKEYSLEMSSGEKVKLNSTFAPSDAFDDRMFFVSLNEDVAKVDVDSGEITAIKKGAATVRCVAASGVFSDVVIYVDGATAADLPDTTTPAAATTDISTNAASSASTASTPAPKTTKTSEPAKGSKVKPVYIAVPAAAVVILASAVVMIKKKKK